MNPLISIIVPCYNCEKLLSDAVNSIISQTYKELEIILVDDCSSDDSYIVAGKIAREDNRIRLLRTDRNRGAAAARNLALDNLRGEYIAFVDSDDYIEPDFIEKLYSILVSNEADISVCGFRKTFRRPQYSISSSGFRIMNDKRSHMADSDCIIRDGLSCATHLVLNDSIIYNVLWNKLYSRRMWDGIRFTEGMASEDFHICYQVMSHASKVVFCRERLYYYYQNPRSVMHTCVNISQYNAVTLDEFEIFIEQRIEDLELRQMIGNEALRYRIDSILEDYYLACKNKNKMRMASCSLGFDELFPLMKLKGCRLPIKFRIFELSRPVYRLGRRMIEIRDNILIRMGLDKQGRVQ